MLVVAAGALLLAVAILSALLESRGNGDETVSATGILLPEQSTREPLVSTLVPIEPSERTQVGPTEHESIGSAADSIPVENLVAPLLDNRPAPQQEKSFEEMSLAELQNAHDELNQVLGEASTPEHHRRLESGLAEFLGPGHEVSISAGDVETQLVAYHAVPGIGMYKTELPRDEYPEFYAMKDRIGEIQAWLEFRKRELVAASSGSGVLNGH